MCFVSSSLQTPCLRFCKNTENYPNTRGLQRFFTHKKAKAPTGGFHPFSDMRQIAMQKAVNCSAKGRLLHVKRRPFTRALIIRELRGRRIRPIRLIGLMGRMCLMSLISHNCRFRAQPFLSNGFYYYICTDDKI